MVQILINVLSAGQEDPFWSILKVVLFGIAVIIGFELIIALACKYAFIRYGLMIISSLVMTVTAFKNGFNNVNFSQAKTWNVILVELTSLFVFFSSLFCEISCDSYYEWEGRVIDHFFSEPEYVGEWKEKNNFWSVSFASFFLAAGVVAGFVSLLSDLVYKKNSHYLLGWCGVAMMAIILIKFMTIVIKIKRNS